MTLTVTANPVRPGEPLSVRWSAPAREATADWFGLSGAGDSNESCLQGLWRLVNDGFEDVARVAVAVR